MPYKRGVNRGMEIRRSVLIFGSNPSIRCYFHSNPDPHNLRKVILWYTFIAMKGRCLFFSLDALGERNVSVAVNL